LYIKNCADLTRAGIRRRRVPAQWQTAALYFLEKQQTIKVFASDMAVISFSFLTY
jgi:hypothetical protein